MREIWQSKGIIIIKITMADIDISLKEIRKEILENPPKDFLSFTDILIDGEVLNIQPSRELLQLFDYVDNERSFFDHSEIAITDWKQYVIKIPATLNDFIWGTKSGYSPQKFLVSLWRKNIIKNLYLPPFLRITKTESGHMFSTQISHSFDGETVLMDALREPEKFNKTVASFQISDWKNYLKIRDEFLTRVVKREIQNIKPALLKSFKQLFKNLKTEYDFASKKYNFHDTFEMQGDELLFDCNITEYHVQNFLSILKDWELIANYDFNDGNGIYTFSMPRNEERLKKKLSDYEMVFNALDVDNASSNERKVPVANEIPKEVIQKIEIVGMPPLRMAEPLKSKNIKNLSRIFLNVSGDLYRDPKEKYCYPMGEKDDRHKIVRFLITNKGYQPTSQIAAQFEDKNEDSVIDTIGKFNSVAKGKLNIKDNIILGKKGSGYRMNPAYTFSLKNE